MRFAPPTALRVSNPAGLNQTNVRTHNERIVLSLLRQHQGLSRVEIGQLSGLSSQAVSVIVRALEGDGLCKAGPVQKGRIGPPSTPMQINPEGAFSLGVHLGRKSADVVVLDFVGCVRKIHTISYDSTGAESALHEIIATVGILKDALPKTRSRRIVGIGLAVPSDIDDWSGDLLSAPLRKSPEKPDLEQLVVQETGADVYVQDDIAAAITGEVLFGAAKDLDDFGYIFIGHHSELRLVLNHRIQARPPAGKPIDLPTISELVEQDLPERHRPDNADGDDVFLVPDPDRVEIWVRTAAGNILEKIAALSGFIGLEKIILDGRVPDTVQKKLLDEINGIVVNEPELQGSIPPVGLGGIGAHCKAFGAACLPIYSRFMLEEVGLP